MIRPQRHRVLAPAILLAVAVAPAPAHAQGASASDLARRTFQNAEQLLRDGKADQALREFQQVVQGYPDSSVADDALARLGSWHYPSESISDLQKVPVAGQEAARPYFEQVREKYPQSDSAPYAYHKLGLLALEPRSPRRNLDEAYATFYGVVNIYPESPLVPAALLGAAVAEIGKRDYDRAILALDRAVQEEPGGRNGAEGQFLLGVANVRLGDDERAAEAFQACRLIEPDGEAARRSLDWLTLLHALRLRPAAGKEIVYERDPGFSVRLPEGEDLRGDLDLAVSPSGELVVADPRRASVMTFARDGTRVRSDPFEGIRSVGFDAFGAPIVASSARIRIAGVEFPAARRSGATVRPVEEPGGVWRSSRSETYVLDLKEGELLRYQDDPASPEVVHRNRDGGTRLAAMASGPEDRLVFADPKTRAVLVLREGKLSPTAAPGVGPALEEPIDVAVDPLGNIYVLDARQRAVFVLDAAGRKIAKIAPPAGSDGEMREPGAIAVGPRGEVYIHDRQLRTILRFRG